MKKYIVIGKRYADKYGNVYHRVRVSEILKDGFQIVGDSPVTYGYGDSYRYTAFNMVFSEYDISSSDKFKDFVRNALIYVDDVRTYKELEGPF